MIHNLLNVKNAPLLSLIFLLILIGCSQKKSSEQQSASAQDSLSTYLSMANDNSLSKAEKQKYTQKAFEIVNSQKEDSTSRANLFKIANRYYNMGDWQGYFKTTKLVLEQSKKNNDSISQAKAYTYLGDYYSLKMVSDSAFYCFYKAEKIYLVQNDNYNLAKTLLSKAYLQYLENNFFNSEIGIFKVLRIIKNQKKNELLYEAYNHLGILYNDWEDYPKALEFHNKALNSIDYKLVSKEFQFKARSLNNIGYVYLNLKNYQQAKIYFENGLKEENLIADSPSLYAMLLDNLAYAKLKLKETANVEKQFRTALQIRENNKLTTGIIVNKIHLSEYFDLIKDKANSTKYAKEALTLARETNQLKSMLEPLKQMKNVDPKNASTYSNEYILISDRLQKAERKMGEKFSRIEYETDEIKIENSNLEDQNKKLLVIFGFFIILAVLIYTIKIQKVKQQELLFKQQQQQANAEIYNLLINQQNTIEINNIEEKKRVARELHDGILGRMFGIRINLDSLNKIKDETGIAQRLNYLTELKNIEQDIREISHNLNREKSELINNFVAIVTNLVEEQKKTYPAKLMAYIDPSIKWDMIDNNVKINLYRILQEGLQNCNKYAEAKKIKVEFKRQDSDNILLRISDDGIGFNVNKAKKGIGLQNIKTRTIDCEGTLEIKSKKEEGTQITVNIPIKKTPNLTV